MNEDDLLRELVIGHLIKRQNEITDMIDNRNKYGILIPEYNELIKEEWSLILQIREYDKNRQYKS